jgi:hypothetical protein
VNQPIDTSPPWWDGTIAIPFSVEEWEYMIQVLNDDLIYHYGLIDDESETMSKNIMDRIQKSIGVE